ncbi:MAG TPA: phospholipase D-like domain-containing protein, partial [bacterium]|nr:phospholipase D-like domain-containing protein [bacterium]
PVVTVVPGENYLDAVNKLLDSATTSIDIHQFNFFTENGPIKQLAQRLIQMKKDNPALKIRIALESVKDGDKPDGVAARNAATKKMFDGTGIDVFDVHGVDGTDGVSHAKVIVVDGKSVLAGSTNWSNTSTTKNNEMNLRVDDPAFACKATSWFDDVIAAPGKPHGSSVTDGDVTMMTDTAYFANALSLVKHTKKGDTLDMSRYWFKSTDPQPAQLLAALRAAAARGVKIRVFLEHSDTIAPGVTAANLKSAAALIAPVSGANAVPIQVFFDPLAKISHTKMLIVNKSTVLVGSTNWAAGDLDDCHQVNWLVKKDPSVAGPMDAWLDKRITTEGTPASEVLATH